ncbi:unnamed protein product [Prunus armeniaca]
MAMEIVNSNCSPTPGALGFFTRCLGSVELVEEANFLIGQLQLLRKLALQSNNFTGIIPNQISNLRNLEILDISL